MSLLFRRTYKAPPSQATHKAGEKATEGRNTSCSIGHEEHVATRVCHSWGYYDAAADETVVVTLHAHYSLHVKVGSGTAEGKSASVPQESSSSLSANEDRYNADDDHQGLCGYTWELTWLPAPLPSISTSDYPLSSSSPACARFSFPRTTPLAHSTRKGNGGVLFLSSRHVLIATETTKAEVAYVLLDSFVVQKPQPHNTRATAPAASSTESHQWRRVEGSVRLPCPFPALSAPAATVVAAHATLLLVYGVQIPSPIDSNNSTNGAQLRVLYVAAFSRPLSTTHDDDEHKENLFGGVADVCVAPAASAGAPTQLLCVPRHAVTELGVEIKMSLPKLCGAAALAPLSSALSLRLSDLLWVYVADKERNRQACVRGTQLYGSLVAVLPCLHDGATSEAVTAAAVASAGMSSLDPLLPAVLCTDFRTSSLYGVLGVVSDGLDAFAKEQIYYHHQYHRDLSTGSNALAVDEVIAQLLPSADRSVYEMEIGRPVEAASTTSVASHLPPQTSVLMFVFDGVVARGGAVGTKQGLYRTETRSWSEVAAAAMVHRIPPARTLWKGLTPIVLSSAKAIGPVYRTTATASDIPREPQAIASLPPFSGHAGAIHDLFLWALADADRWTAYVATMGSGGSASPPVKGTQVSGVASSTDVAMEEAEEDDDEAEGETIAALPLSAIARTPATVIATHTAVETVVSTFPSTVVCCLAKRSTLTRELEVWYYVQDEVGEQESNAEADTTSTKASTMAACLPPLFSTTTDLRDWEDQVAEWVVSRYLLSPSVSSITAENDADAVALVSTFAVMKILWAHAIAGTSDAKLRAVKPAWPQILFSLLYSTEADAAQPQTRLRAYAYAVQSLVSAHLASKDSSSSSSSSETAQREAELAHMQAAAVVFLRLVLRVLIELDWHAGDVDGRRCAQWMARWFLGAAAVLSSNPRSSNNAAEESENESVTRRCLAEGRAMQILMQLGAAAVGGEHTLAWLRRMVLLYTCRNPHRPLELTLADVVEAADIALDTPEKQKPLDGWSEDDSDGGGSGGINGTAALPTSHSGVDLVEWRESIEYALLRMVRPEALHDALHNLTYNTHSRLVSCTAPVKEVLLLHGLLSISDLHELLADGGWTSGQVQSTVPLGFSFICLLVDVAMRVLIGTPVSTAESYEKTILTALDAWEGREDGSGQATSRQAMCIPVYPLLSLCSPAALHERLQSAATAPFPFSILPPLLTVYLWYHVVDRLCRRLKLLPRQPSSLPGEGVNDADVHDGNDAGNEEEELLVWVRRGRTDAPQLTELHRGLCVLRCLVQNDPLCAEELFAAMQLVYTSRLEDNHASDVERVQSGTTSYSWGTQYLVAWQHLLSLEAPPLSEQGAVAAYRERCVSRGPHFADLMRVLHLVYASAGSGHALRAQLWRATAGPVRKQKENTEHDDVYTHSQVQLEHSLQVWITAARQASHNTTNAALTNTRSDSVTSDLVGPWLTQILSHVMMCDSAAVTDVGVYEQVYAALAHAKQKVSSAASTSAARHSLHNSVSPSVAAANVAFAVLRPCLMYAYPLLLQLAIEDELMGSLPENYASSGLSSSQHTRCDVGAFTRQRFLQLNEPLVWPSRTARVLGSPRCTRQLEQLCAGEIGERVRRQLSRLVGLYEARMSTATMACGGSGGGDGDARFRVLAMLLPLLPSVVDLAQRQRRLLRSSGAEASQQNSPKDDHADSDTEGTLELSLFYLSPTAAYVMAASALAVGDTDGVSVSLSMQQQRQQSPKHLGWFTVSCEVLRRELHTYVVTELLLAWCIEKIDVAAPSIEWRLVASESKLKAFINALADAVEPATQALAEGLQLPLYRSMVLLLIFGVLHQLFFPRAKVEATRSSLTTIHADLSLAQLVKQWIRQVVTPLYSHLAVDDQKTVLHVMTSDFVEEYLKSDIEEPTNSTAQLPHGTQGWKADVIATYKASKVHHTWQQWRQNGSALYTSTSATTEAAMLACVEHCVTEGKRPVLHLSPPLGTPDSTVPSIGPYAAQALSDVLLETNHSNSNHINGGSGGGGTASWIEVGSALRSSFIHTIGATVASRPAQPARNVSAGSLSTTAIVGVPTPLSCPLSMEVACATSRNHAAPSLARDTAEAVQLLCKEELFLRGQLARQLLEARQHDFFASPAFQHALVRLYLAMRMEKRRKELVAFALDQHDLIFTFVSREQQHLHAHYRQELRQAWVDYGERQRLALRRLLQEERDARMGVQAMAYADRAYLREVEQAENTLWVWQEEGRREVALHEQDARDALTVSAAKAEVELAKKAVEAEEEAYWMAEEEEWARLEEEASGTGVTSFTATRSKKSEQLGEERMKPAVIGGKHTALKSGAVDSTHPHSTVVDAATATTSIDVSPPETAARYRAALSTKQTGGQRSEEKERKSYLQTGLSHVVAQAAAEVGTSNLFGTLSRWQTALRETVAPAPPASRQSGEKNSTERVKATASQGEVSLPSSLLLSAPTSHVVASKVKPAEETVSAVKFGVNHAHDEDDWGWGSEASDENVKETKPTKPTLLRCAPTLTTAGVNALEKEMTQNPQKLSPIIASVVPLTSRRIVPLHSTASKPARPKKRLATALLVEPISSTSMASLSRAPTVVPQLQHPTSPQPREEEDEGQDSQSHVEGAPPPPRYLEDATPNPVRSIFSAVEAAAMETISKVRRDAPPVQQRDTPRVEETGGVDTDTPPSTGQTTERTGAFEASTDGKAAPTTTEVANIEEEDERRGWSDDEVEVEVADGEVQKAVRIRTLVENAQKTVLLPSQSATVSLDASAAALAGPPRAPSTIVHGSPPLMKSSPSGWSDSDEVALGSGADTIPHAALFEPLHPFSTAAKLTAAQLQQLYVEEVETRERMLSWL